ncbi:hypothetical protein MAIT1_01999 [Magnetofaba australis IT-1]|uniref:Uncharacterized protein n=1 Tax=Magnetofaba australis IT-1 TaxID=1434232 RepID=A0A1Y2K1P6_9PROT|nr:hypothetical protein MAIT1_01999 [Magnetofaba australis IT-1]
MADGLGAHRAAPLQHGADLHLRPARAPVVLKRLRLMGVFAHHRELRNDRRVAQSALLPTAAQRLHCGVDAGMFGSRANGFETLRRQPVEADDQPLEGGIQYPVDGVPTVQQRAIGVEHQIAAADLMGVVQPLPQLLAQQQRLAVEGGPQFALWRALAHLLDDAPPQRRIHVLLGALQAFMGAVRTAQIAMRGVLHHQLRREWMFAQIRLDAAQLRAALRVVQMRRQAGEVGLHTQVRQKQSAAAGPRLNSRSTADR